MPRSRLTCPRSPYNFIVHNIINPPAVGGGRFAFHPLELWPAYHKEKDNESWAMAAAGRARATGRDQHSGHHLLPAHNRSLYLCWAAVIRACQGRCAYPRFLLGRFCCGRWRRAALSPAALLTILAFLPATACVSLW